MSGVVLVLVKTEIVLRMVVFTLTVLVAEAPRIHELTIGSALWNSEPAEKMAHYIPPSPLFHLL